MKLTIQEIQFRGIDLTVEGFYTSGEPEVMYDSDLCGSPEFEAEFDIRKVFIQDTEISSLLSEDDLDEIANLLILKMGDE